MKDQQPLIERIRLMKSSHLHTTTAILILVLITGCTGTSTLYSKTFVRPSKAVTEINFLYIENKLQDRHGRSNTALTKVGYTDLPELLNERVPIIFKMNGITTDYAAIEKVNFGLKQKINAIKWSKLKNPKTGLLVVQVSNGYISTTSGNSTVVLNMHANLFSGTPRKRLWTGQFRNRLAKAPLGTIGFDNEFVDNLLKTILEQMSKDGIIILPDNNAVIPSYSVEIDE